MYVYISLVRSNMTQQNSEAGKFNSMYILFLFLSLVYTFTTYHYCIGNKRDKFSRNLTKIYVLIASALLKKSTNL